MRNRKLEPILNLSGVPTAEVLAGKKDIHCKITKEEFVRCKVRLFPHGVSMGKMLTWLVKQVAEEDPRALSLVEDLIKSEISKRLNEHRREAQDRKSEWYDELDQTTLYGLIDDALNDRNSAVDDA